MPDAPQWDVTLHKPVKFGDLPDSRPIARHAARLMEKRRRYVEAHYAEELFAASMPGRGVLSHLDPAIVDVARERTPAGERIAMGNEGRAAFSLLTRPAGICVLEAYAVKILVFHQPKVLLVFDHRVMRQVRHEVDSIASRALVGSYFHAAGGNGH